MTRHADQSYTRTNSVIADWFSPESPNPVARTTRLVEINGTRGPEDENGVREDTITITQTSDDGRTQTKGPMNVKIDSKRTAELNALPIDQQIAFADRLHHKAALPGSSDRP